MAVRSRTEAARREVTVVRRARACLPTLLAVTGGVLVVRSAWPAPANAVDLFPVDDWVGSGLSKAGEVVLGPLRLGAKEIARLLATIVGALADLLVPKSLVKAGLGGIRWLVQLPPVGTSARPQPGVPDVRMPHLVELRDVMTWIGVTLLPLGLVVSGARAFLAPTSDGDSPADVFARAITAGIGLLIYDWAWGVLCELSRLLTSGLLGLPWVADGVERMLETLVIGGASGSVVASEFVVPLLIMVAGTILLGLLLVRVGLEVATALLYVLGGLVLGLSVTGFGRRLLSAWLIAAGAIVALPLLWSAVFTTGAALMLDAGQTGGRGGFASFVAQLYNVAAALAVFWIAIKLALGVFRHATAAITGITTAPGPAGGAAPAGRSGGSLRLQALAQNATPAGLARFSQTVRGGVAGATRGLAGGAAGALSYPARHPVRSAQAASYPVRRPVQATREAADRLSDALRGGRGAASLAAVSADVAGASVKARAAGWYRRERDGGRFWARAANARAGARPAAGARPGAGATPPSSALSPPARSSGRSAPGVDPSITTARWGRGDGAPAGEGEREPSPVPRPGAGSVGRGSRPLWWPRARRRKKEGRDGKGQG